MWTTEEMCIRDRSRLDAQIEANAGKLGDMTGRAKRAAEQAGKLSDLREKAGKYARIADKIARDEAELKQWEEKFMEASRNAGPRLPDEPTYDCPNCGTVLRLSLIHIFQRAVSRTGPGRSWVLRREGVCLGS